VNPSERSIEIIVPTLSTTPFGQVGIGMMALGGVLFAFDGNKLATFGWLWPNRKLSLGMVGCGTFLSAPRLFVWLVRG
jgi:hypothetical protein